MPFLLVAVFDRAIMFRFICQIELLFTATLLALVLVCLVGAIQSLTRFFLLTRDGNNLGHVINWGLDPHITLQIPKIGFA
ncbi:MAG: hypothetical protein ACR652_02975 [Methylocystis sp.]|uniref:hypothetical protein n=1 Tax=Methylocystis sp. TaxID=1911079 RepID=UPI003DA2DD4B